MTRFFSHGVTMPLALSVAALTLLGSLNASAHHSTGLFDGTTLITV